MKINLGCGTDCRDGFVNVDGSDALPGVNKVIDIGRDNLLDHFEKDVADYILAQDIIEHHYHWVAQRILEECFHILKIGGELQVRVPDVKWIILNPLYSIEKKIVLIFGGQDIPQGHDQEMDESRKQFPQFFCHKYGWTQKSMKQHLADIGFTKVQVKREGNNLVANAIK